MDFLQHFKAARRVSTPLIVVRTPDPAATMKTIALDNDHKGAPMIVWDCVRGLIAVNEPLGKKLIKDLIPSDDLQEVCNPVEMLVRALKMPKESVLFMSNLHRFMVQDHGVMQAVWNLRDAFKQNTRTLVILCPGMTLPPELSQDVLVLDEPLPDAAQLTNIIVETYKAASVTGPTAEVVSRGVDALCGLAAFPAEQVCAMSIRKSGLDMENLWERKRQQIEQTPGLSVWRGKEMFTDIGGCLNSKTFISRVLNGEDRPRAIVFQDEIEKAFAGSAGDSSGTTQELLGSQLSFMQDHNSTGLLFIGHPGAAKSAMAKAAGNEGGIPTIQFDLGSMKGSLVGESNANMRNALKVVEAVSQGRALFIATSNDIKGLPPELRRRFSFGTFFFDLPTNSERKLIWNIYFEKFKLDKKLAIPEDKGWTGAEIKNCCDLAYRLKITLIEAATYIVPLATSASERIQALRREADGRYISAGTPGPYKAPEGMEVEEEERPTLVVGVISPPKRKITTPKGEQN